MGRHGRRRRLAARARDYARRLLAFLFSNVGVVVLVVAYTIAGAFMFQAIEGGGEMEREHNMTVERDNTAQYLWNVTLTLNLFNETELRERLGFEIHKYERKVVRAVKKGWDGGRSSRQWSFSSAFLYSLTVITTIGYGHLSPRTGWGKVTTILYALLGMPLFLLYLSNVGELLARWFKCLYALVCLCQGCPGFTRRRVARLRSQVAEISDPESIEQPAHWRGRQSDSDADFHPHPERYPRGYHDPRSLVRVKDAPYRRPDYLRSPSQPQPYGRPERFDPRARGWSDPARVWSDPARGWHDPARGWIDPARGWSDPALEDSETSEFTYVTFDAQAITVPISVCIFILVGYVMFGSMIFGNWEKWGTLDGAYFCFISLSSIGFGDFVPGERIYTARIETSFIVCSMYLMLGMALVAMTFNLMQEQVIHYFAAIKRALKRICRCKR